MPIETVWDIQEMDAYECIPRNNGGIDDVADELTEYIPECVIDAINQDYDADNPIIYTRLTLVRIQTSRGKVKDVKRAIVGDDGLPEQYPDSNIDVPAKRHRELAKFLADNGFEFEDEGGQEDG
tara:strand:- start:236 stop:607 length:372 start_codon:yes stop_codon:yes gene_type:complete